MGGHVEFEGAPLEELLVGEVGLGEGFAVEAHLLDVAVAVADFGGFDFECLAVGKGDFEVGEVRGTEDVLSAAWADGIEAHGAEEIPGRHLAAVVVAAEAVDVVAVHIVHNLA